MYNRHFIWQIPNALLVYRLDLQNCWSSLTPKREEVLLRKSSAYVRDRCQSSSLRRMSWRGLETLLHYLQWWTTHIQPHSWQIYQDIQSIWLVLTWKTKTKWLVLRKLQVFSLYSELCDFSWEKIQTSVLATCLWYFLESSISCFSIKWDWFPPRFCLNM